MDAIKVSGTGVEKEETPKKATKKEMKNVLKSLVKAVILLALVVLVRYLITGKVSLSRYDFSIVIIVAIDFYARNIYGKKRTV